MDMHETFHRFAQRDGFEGYGYIGGRRALSWENLLAADAMLQEAVDRLGLGTEALFEWANSKAGRWYAESWADGNAYGHAAKYLPTR